MMMHHDVVFTFLARDEKLLDDIKTYLTLK